MKIKINWKFIWYFFKLIYFFIFFVYLIILFFSIIYRVLLDNLDTLGNFVISFIILVFSLSSISLQLGSYDYLVKYKRDLYNLSKNILLSSIIVFLAFFMSIYPNNSQNLIKLMGNLILIIGVGIFTWNIFHLILVLFFPEVFNFIRGRKR